MRQPYRRLGIAVITAAWLATFACGEAMAQRSKLLEFGPDAIEGKPPGRAIKAAAAPAEPPGWDGRPWVLASASELRLPPPPDERAAARERRELRTLAVGDDADALERVRYWDVGSTGQRWIEMLAEMSDRADLGDATASRAFALLTVAMHDARIAAWDSQSAHKRLRPSELDARLVPEVMVPPNPSYPCEHAVVAGAAAAILAHVFPAEAQRFAAAAHEAAWSRVAASAVYPSDAEAGLGLGRAVAARVIDSARTNPGGFRAVASRRPPAPRGERERADTLLAEHGHADPEGAHGVGVAISSGQEKLRTAHEDRADCEPQDRQGPRPHDPSVAVAVAAGGPGDRMR